jgi:hypothetical protein
MISTVEAGFGARGLGRVTVRVEIKDTSPGPVWIFASDDPALHRLWT